MYGWNSQHVSSWQNFMLSSRFVADVIDQTRRTDKMSVSTIIGSVGVSLLLIAFLLSLFKVISQESITYSLLNIIGAALAGYASWLIDYMPFVVLEGTWCLVAIAGLVRAANRGKR